MVSDEIESVMEELKKRYLNRLRDDNLELFACEQSLCGAIELEVPIAKAKNIAHRLAGVSRVFGFEGVQSAAEIFENFSLVFLRDGSDSTTLLLVHLRTLQSEIDLIVLESVSD